MNDNVMGLKDWWALTISPLLDHIFFFGIAVWIFVKLIGFIRVTTFST